MRAHACTYACMCMCIHARQHRQRQHRQRLCMYVPRYASTRQHSHGGRTPSRSPLVFRSPPDPLQISSVFRSPPDPLQISSCAQYVLCSVLCLVPSAHSYLLTLELCIVVHCAWHRWSVSRELHPQLKGVGLLVGDPWRNLPNKDTLESLVAVRHHPCMQHVRITCMHHMKIVASPSPLARPSLTPRPSTRNPQPSTHNPQAHLHHTFTFTASRPIITAPPQAHLSPTPPPDTTTTPAPRAHPSASP